MTDYITLSNFKSRFGITTSTDNDRISAHITAASLWVDSYCGRQFGPGSEGSRSYEPDSWGLVRIDDCHTITAVAIDNADDGTFGITLTEGTDYTALPHNGIGPNGQSGWPTTQLEATGRTYWFPKSNYRPRSVQVSATFGWAAVPTDVVEATYLLAHRLYYEVDVPSGNVPGGEFGAVPLRRPWTAEMMLKPYVRADRMKAIV